MSSEDGHETVEVLRVRVQVDREEDVPPRVMRALEELADALAAEEFPVSGELAEKLHDEAEVVGFGMGSGGLRIGDIGGVNLGNPKNLNWCVGYSSGDGGSCGVYGQGEDEPSTNNCTIRLW